MRALVKESAGPGIVLREVPVPVCGPSEALIRVHYAGVCGTDLHIWEWDAWASQVSKRSAGTGGPELEHPARTSGRRGAHRSQELLRVMRLLTPPLS